MGGSQASAFDGLITLSFIDYEDRGNKSSQVAINRLSNALLNKYP